MATPSVEALRREPFHRFEDPFAAAIAMRLDQDPSELAPRWLAASAATALRLSIERWTATGAKPGALGPLVDTMLDFVRTGFVVSLLAGGAWLLRSAVNSLRST